MESQIALLIVLVLCFTRGTTLTCTNYTNIGETKQLEVSASLSSQFVCIQLNNTLEPIRISVDSENATSRHPLLVTTRQPMGINSWTLPYVESGFSYTFVEQTLCPLLNRDDTGSAILIIDMSTTQSTPLSVTLRTTLVSPFRLEMNTPVTLEASPSGPAYLLYEFEDPPVDRRVRVNFLSMDNTSEICAIASVQTSFCPVVDLLDNPDHRGRFQTMRSIASITTKENITEPHFGYFYVVLSVLPNDGEDNSCLSTTQGLGDELLLFGDAVDNFNPTAYSGPDRTKRVVVTVEFVSPDLGAAIAVPIVVYCLFVVIASVWIAATLFIRQKKKQNSFNMNETQNGISLEEQTGNGHQLQEAGRATETANESNGKDVPCENTGNQQEQQQTRERLYNRNGSTNGTTTNGQETGDHGVTNGTTANGQETGDHVYKRMKVNVNMAELGEIDDSASVQKEYFHFSIYLLAIIVFYSVPAYQLVITYQKLVFSSGNEDICYYNSLCAVPLDTTTIALSAFNNIFSNIGYVFLGALYIGVACMRRRRYQRQEETNEECPHQEKKGVPQTFGIYYAIGLTMIAQAFMSVAYHLCPSTTNYQFDVTFMYVMAVLGMIKVLTTRAPDLAPALHRHAFFLVILIIVVVLGGVLFQYLAFKIIFIFLYVITALYYSVEVYYRWQIKLNPKSIKLLFVMYKEAGLCPPQHTPKFMVVIISLILNLVIAGGIFLAEAQNIDFARYFLLIVLVNFLIYLGYYLAAKCVYKECFTKKVLKPIFYAAIALCMWIVSIYFFVQNVTDTSVSPALSRDGNKECLAFGFYDSHDLWHFMSSFALFFSFSILLTMDEGQEDVHRSVIKTF